MHRISSNFAGRVCEPGDELGEWPQQMAQAEVKAASRALIQVLLSPLTLAGEEERGH